MKEYTLPEQRVSRSRKNEPSWYESTCDYLIAKATSINDKSRTRRLYNIAKGIIDQDDYEATLNPYNAKHDEFTKYPVSIKNNDIVKPIIRRYVGEYIRQVHEIMIVSVNEDIVFARNKKLEQEVTNMAFQAFINELNNLNVDTGVDSKEVPDLEEFVVNFKRDYILEESMSAQDILEAVESHIDAGIYYAQLYAEFVITGECYCYKAVKGNKIITKVINGEDAFPIPNGETLVEDYDAFICRDLVTVAQILDEDRENLSDADVNTIKKLLDNATFGAGRGLSLTWQDFISVQNARYDNNGNFIGHNCAPKGSKNLSTQDRVRFTNRNDDMVERWHVTFRAEVKKGILTFLNELGLEETLEVTEDFKLDKSIGHLNIEWYWDTEVYEIYRYGNENTGFYTKPQPIAYQRDGKLPYNGLMEYLPGLGRFSIPEILHDYNVQRNILIFYRDLTIAKLKSMIVAIPQSILGDDAISIERNMHRINAAGLLIYDDSVDGSVNKVSNGIKQVDPSIDQYIKNLTDTINTIKDEAWEAVDMTAQRYGQIANSAGKGTTQEAIIRGTMGSVIVVSMFDKFRQSDLAGLVDYSKLAWIEGKNEAFKDKDGTTRYMSLDINTHISSDYMLYARNSEQLSEDLQILKDIAFSAAQNGEFKKAIAAVKSKSIDKLESVIKQLEDEQRQYEMNLEAMQTEREQLAREGIIELAQIEQGYTLEQIAAKGEIDREIAIIKTEGGFDKWDNEPGKGSNYTRGLVDQYRNTIEQQKLQRQQQRDARADFEADRKYNLDRQKANRTS